MFKKKNVLEEGELLSTEELCETTKKTLKSYIKANTFVGAATGLVAGVTMLSIPLVEETNKKIFLGCTGAVLTAATLGTVVASFRKMDDFIDNHADAVKFRVVEQFLEARGEGAKEDLLDSMIDELHGKFTSDGDDTNA